jgi:hypothetical protein
MNARNGAVDSRSPPPLTAAINAPATVHNLAGSEQKDFIYKL